MSNLRKYFSLENILIFCSSVGLFSAAMLTIEKIHLLENPGEALNCDLNPVIACGSVINTMQASAFGFPNPILGVAAFAFVLAIGVAIKAGAKFRPWLWQGLQLGVSFGIGFTHWLMYQSIFNIQALCPFCMVVWTIMIILFVYVTRYNLSQKYVPNYFGKHLYQFKAYQVVILWYLLIFGLILFKFWYYWQTIPPFSWMGAI